MNKEQYDKYKHYNVDVCLVCELAIATPRGNGIRPMICGSCCKKAIEKFKEWNTNGMYLTKHKESQ